MSTAIMNETEIKTAVRGFIIENFLFGDEESMVSERESFMESGVIDSTGILELITYLEESFEITLEDNELVPENLDSLNNVAKFVISKK